MKSSIRDKAEGLLHQVKGSVIGIAGKISDNPKLQHKGIAEKIAGKVQEMIGQTKKFMGK